MTKFKLHNTDGKTFFDFRSNPESRCEGFTVSYLDDGTVVMSGDYGTLCWKRNYHHEKGEFRRDYGFPSQETGIRYFDEKVCQFGIKQEVEKWDEEKAKEEIENEILKDFKIKKNDYECFPDWKYYSFEQIKDKFYEERPDAEEDELDKEKVMYLLKEMRFEFQNEMHRDLMDFDSHMNTDYASENKYGEGYVHQFEFIFKCLQEVSEQIIEAVNKNGNKK